MARLAPDDARRPEPALRSMFAFAKLAFPSRPSPRVTRSNGGPT
ncbi:hypothetical protein BMA10247_A2284 [Burkholderia mallei NCTC 10247]|nr:hypothetical protein BURPS668_A3177 [Burkholderia pseudomallei 668]ABO02658.1 hypothetical protein BMA10247_A2284 [Burkholderia mallei NCTC 10247]